MHAASASHSASVTVDEYLRSEFEPDADYVDGEIEERPMGEYDHASWQEAILKWFWRHETEWRIRAKPELRIRTSATRFRVPDVTIMRRDQPIEQILTHPPFAVFEVLSPEDRLRRMSRKLGDYAAMGIGHVYVIDPEGPVYYRFQNGELRLAAEFGAAGEAIHFPLAAIAALLD
ncbi:MAG: Uma2 family endonuclease [Terriglobales bacterium]